LTTLFFINLILCLCDFEVDILLEPIALGGLHAFFLLQKRAFQHDVSVVFIASKIHFS